MFVEFNFNVFVFMSREITVSISSYSVTLKLLHLTARNHRRHLGYTDYFCLYATTRTPLRVPPSSGGTDGTYGPFRSLLAHLHQIWSTVSCEYHKIVLINSVAIDVTNAVTINLFRGWFLPSLSLVLFSSLFPRFEMALQSS